MSPEHGIAVLFFDVAPAHGAEICDFRARHLVHSHIVREQQIDHFADDGGLAGKSAHASVLIEYAVREKDQPS